jgi:hypothetical protein
MEVEWKDYGEKMEAQAGSERDWHDICNSKECANSVVQTTMQESCQL